MTIDMTRKRCPKCGDTMRLLENSQRTVPLGTWFEVICPRCRYRVDVYKPRRTNRP